MLIGFVASALAIDLDPAQKAVVTVAGMDCAGCEAEIRQVLGAIDGVSAVEASFADGRACLTLTKPVSEDAVVAALKTIELTAGAIATAEACPASGPKPAGRDPWADAAGVDVVTVSRPARSSTSRRSR
jgi:copper chaperone CopZ